MKLLQEHDVFYMYLYVNRIVVQQKTIPDTHTFKEEETLRLCVTILLKFLIMFTRYFAVFSQIGTNEISVVRSMMRLMFEYNKRFFLVKKMCIFNVSSLHINKASY